MPATFTIIDESRPTNVDATIDADRVLISPNAVERSLGWALKPEGFCRGQVCIPVREDSRAVIDGSVDLARLADLLGRPIALDIEERAAALGASPHDRGAELATLQGPDFTLPDLEGRMHSLSDHRGKKVFLAVWASW
jgi:hypothetical protein